MQSICIPAVLARYEWLFVVGDVIEGGVELGIEAAVVVFAQHYLIGSMADAFGHLATDKGFECGGVDVVS